MARGISYVVRRNQDETNASFERRSWFVNKIDPQNDDDFEKAVVLAEAWVNWKYLGCKYPINVMKDIQKVLQKK